MQLFCYEFEYFYQCIMTFLGLRDSKGPILMHQAHLIKINEIDSERRFVNLFGEFSPLCAAAAAADKLTTSVQVVKEHKKVNVDNVSS